MGYVGHKMAGPIVIAGLRQLATRGYDSAGIVSRNGGEFDLRRATGKIDVLESVLEHMPVHGTIAIGHTRWATHGDKTERNAHPHVVGNVAVVHNGIIENHEALRQMIKNAGQTFASETDTEVIPHIINDFLEMEYTPLEAVRETMGMLEGKFALGIMIKSLSAIIAVSKGNPLVVGFSKNGSSIGSDPLAIASIADRYVRLKDGDVAIVSGAGATIYDFEGKRASRAIKPMAIAETTQDKGDFHHIMEKEIHGQSDSVAATIRSLSDPTTHRITLPPLPFNLATVTHLSILACGTASYAGLVAKYFFEAAGIPVSWEAASEFTERNSPIIPGSGAIFPSQSGETADTIAAIEKMKEAGVPTLGIVNVPGSTMTEITDGTIPTMAYPEIAVASTKAFTAQLAVFVAMAIETARLRGKLTPEREAQLIAGLNELPHHIRTVLELDPKLGQIGRTISHASRAFYIGRGTNYAVALEGALKMKEISYIHAEAYPAGELKHGPLALIEQDVPVFVIAPPDQWFTKTASNLEEVRSRGGRIILVSSGEKCRSLADKVWASIALPEVDPMLNPILYSVALQLIAYHAAVARGTDVDQPRNLAKSVTVQ